jgi:hypothetical protein
MPEMARLEPRVERPFTLANATPVLSAISRHIFEAYNQACSEATASPHSFLAIATTLFSHKHVKLEHSSPYERFWSGSCCMIRSLRLWWSRYLWFHHPSRENAADENGQAVKVFNALISLRQYRHEVTTYAALP